MTNARRLIQGAVWLYGAQMATSLIQLAYAAITSRALGAQSFGAYAVALVVSKLVSLVVNGGLAQAILRNRELTPELAKSFVSTGLISGTSGALFLMLTAHWWASIWHTPQATNSIKLLSLLVLIGPVLNISNAVFRKRTEFRSLAILTLSSNLLGMTVGTLAVVGFRTAESLLVSTLVAQFSLLVGLCIRNSAYLFGLRKVSSIKSHLSFSLKVSFSSIGSYLISNLPNWATSNVLGSAALGHWNRADALTTVPLSQVQGAIIQVLYPNFRPHEENRQNIRTLWSDLLTLVAWPAFSTMLLGAVCLPRILKAAFGPGWEVASSYTIPLSIIGGSQLLVVLLASAVEAMGWFKVVLASQVAQAVIISAGIVFLFTSKNIIYMFGAIVLSLITQHVIQLRYAALQGQVDLKKVIRGYGGAMLFAAGYGAVIQLTLFSFESLGTKNLLGYLGIGFAVIGVVLTLIFWKKLPPIALARKYGIMGS